MQREIAHVMAACAMRGMRYISFPPIVFETPAPTRATDASAPEGQADTELAKAATPVLAADMAPSVASPMASTIGESAPIIDAAPVSAPPEASPLAEPLAAPLAAPLTAMRPLTEWAEPAQETAPRPAAGRLRRLSELAASESQTPGDPERRPRFALLNDIAVELRPRRQRARSGQSENQMKPNPTSPPWP